LAVDSHAPQGGVDCVLAHGAPRIARAWEDEAALARQGVELPEDGDRLLGQGDEVGRSLGDVPALHPLAWNDPLPGVQVELRPLSPPQLCWPHEGQRREAEGAQGDEAPLIALDGPEEASDFGGVGYRCPMPGRLWLK